jgi:hypothetical protein
VQMVSSQILQNGKHVSTCISYHHALCLKTYVNFVYVDKYIHTKQSASQYTPPSENHVACIHCSQHIYRIQLASALLLTVYSLDTDSVVKHPA